MAAETHQVLFAGHSHLTACMMKHQDAALTACLTNSGSVWISASVLFAFAIACKGRLPSLSTWLPPRQQELQPRPRQAGPFRHKSLTRSSLHQRVGFVTQTCF